MFQAVYVVYIQQYYVDNFRENACLICEKEEDAKRYVEAYGSGTDSDEYGEYEYEYFYIPWAVCDTETVDFLLEEKVD